MTDHPVYAMWQQLYVSDTAAKADRDRLRRLREEERRGWRDAWDAYERHYREAQRTVRRRPWWKAAVERCVGLVLWMAIPPARWIATRRRGRS